MATTNHWFSDQNRATPVTSETSETSETSKSVLLEVSIKMLLFPNHPYLKYVIWMIDMDD